MKQFKKGLILGRFQTFHKGHEYIIDKALELCDSVLVFIGSSDKSGTIDNPFDFDTRKALLEAVYKDKIRIEPLPDLGVGNVPRWGEYVLENASKFDSFPDCIVHGIEDKCELWFSEDIRKKITFVKVDRGDIKINASTLRQYMYDNEYDKWKEFINPKLHKYYSTLRIQLIKAYVNPSKPKITLIDDDN